MPHISSVPFCWNPTLYWESNRPMQSYSHFANTISWSRTRHWRCCPYRGGNENKWPASGTSKQPHTTEVAKHYVLDPITQHSSGWLYSRCIRYQTREKVKPIGAQQVAVWDRLWLYIWINTTHPEPSCSSSTNVHLWRWVLARMFWLLNIITDVWMRTKFHSLSLVQVQDSGSTLELQIQSAYLQLLYRVFGWPAHQLTLLRQQTTANLPLDME